MKIVSLSIRNFKKITAVEISPDGNIITISGRNGAGKSSILDAIFTTLRGASGAVERPIRAGTSKGKVEIDIGEYIITKSFSTRGGSKLEISRADGSPVAKPQTVLDSLMRPISFDPSDFLGMKPKDQRETLIKMIDLKPDWKQLDFKIDESIPPLDALDSARASAFASRTDVNRDIKRLAGVIDTERDSLPNGAADLRRLSIRELTEKYEDVSRAYRDRDSAEMQRQQAEKMVKVSEDEIERHTREIERLRAKIAELQKSISELPVVDPARLVDLNAIRKQIADAESVNRIIDKIENIKSTEKEHAALTDQAERLSFRIEGIDHFKAHLLASSSMPIPGLGIDSDCLLYNTIPLSQASHAERLRVSVLLGMASNPELRVMRISDGEKFDDEAWAILRDMAAQNDYQLWIEKMENEPCGDSIFIVDGSIAGADAIDSEIDAENGGDE
jgi:DNA repair exonuclease SbcCD ATPase subunit